MKLIEVIRQSYDALKEAQKMGFETQRTRDIETASYWDKGQERPVQPREIYGLRTAMMPRKYAHLGPWHPLSIAYGIGVIRAKTIPIENYMKNKPQ